jgi:hypothetical protein
MMKTFQQFNEGRVKFKMEFLKDANVDIAILSAERDGSADNASNSRKLEGLIKSSGYDYEPATGGFVENKGTPEEKLVDGEKSFVVVDTEDKGGLIPAMTKLGKKFDQDAILIKPKDKANGFFMGTTTRKGILPRYRHTQNIGKPRWGSKGTYYTKIKDGFFTFGS